MSLIQLLSLKTWETGLSKIPRLQTETRITVAYGLDQFAYLGTDVYSRERKNTRDG